MVDNSQLNIFEELWDVEKAIQEQIEAADEAFYILNLSDVVKKYEMWVEEMPRIKPFYAVKCNDNELVIKTLAELGTGFDCASKGEIQKVLSIMENLCLVELRLNL